MNRKAIQIHDVVNLWLIPIVGVLTVLGLLDVVNPVRVTEVFVVYVIIDVVWLLVQPDAVPSLPNVILLHHAVTIVLLLFPIWYNDLAIYTCWDGLCEINTFFLIARRQFKPYRNILGIMYWATFIPMRTILYPIMLVEFYYRMQEHEFWKLLVVCGCQAVLIVFNFVLLWMGASKSLKRKWKEEADKKKSSDPKKDS
ncbi:hypothetical protein M9434_000137 [Picochlorum sp. BPE23]|nr:hypothetical protein M9434_000137 [Picochlorum sp. BPE23]